MARREALEAEAGPEPANGPPEGGAVPGPEEPEAEALEAAGPTPLL